MVVELLERESLSSEFTRKETNLTERQLEVLKLTAHGATSEEIACALVLSPKTVDNHRARILDRLGVSNEVAAVTVALDIGLFNVNEFEDLRPLLPVYAEPLSPRESQILGFVFDGMTSLQIAKANGVSPKTVDNQVAASLDKLGAPNRASAPIYYRLHFRK